MPRINHATYCDVQSQELRLTSVSLTLIAIPVLRILNAKIYQNTRAYTFFSFPDYLYKFYFRLLLFEWHAVKVYLKLLCLLRNFALASAFISNLLIARHLGELRMFATLSINFKRFHARVKHN